jgi:hypothetical protein
MNGKFFVRLLGVAACVGAFATSNEAEAGRWHRRHRSEPVCCEPVCCEPVCCEPVCCEPVCCEPVCCEPVCELVASYDNCGRIVYRRPVCCETIVSSRIVVPATRCCDIAGTGSVDAGSVATTPAQESLAATTASVVK